ncbi:13111_t:CDS:2, partial [Gigaspora margarita]
LKNNNGGAFIEFANGPIASLKSITVSHLQSYKFSIIQVTFKCNEGEFSISETEEKKSLLLSVLSNQLKSSNDVSKTQHGNDFR